MKIGIVVQGPLHDERCIDILIEKYKNQKNNCIISTWDDQPIELIKKLESENFNLLINNREDVKYVGWSNCNLQFHSSTSGLLKFQDLEYTHLLKIRTDTIPSDVDLFLDILSKKSTNKIVLMCWITGTEIDYFIDFFSFGPKKQVFDFWNIYQEESENPMFTEQYLLFKHLGIKNPNLNDVENVYDFCLKELFKSGIQINWEKPSYRYKGDYVSQYYWTITNSSCIRD